MANDASDTARVRLETSTAHVTVLFNGVVVADTRRPLLVHETGLASVWYIPEADLRGDVLTPSDRHSHCPYKGDAQYHGLSVEGREVADALWTYPTPLAAVAGLAGHVAFYTDKVDAIVVEDGA